MSFANPRVLWFELLVAAFAIGLYFYDRARRAQLTRRLGELPVIGRALASSSPARRAIKAALAGAGLALVVFAAARPQREGKRDVEVHGLDLVVALDVSKSMMVDDVGPTLEMTEKKIESTRLARARELALATIDELEGDRIAPVVFAGAASHFPLTEDHVVAGNFLTDLGPADLPPGSNLAEVIRVSRCLLRPDLYDDLHCAKIARRGHGGDPMPGESLDPIGSGSGSGSGSGDLDEIEQTKIARGKAIAIFTDGAEATPEAIHEMEAARELGVAVFLIGVGTEKGGLVHEIDAFGKRTQSIKHDRAGKEITSVRDDVGMTALADAGGDKRRFLITNATGEVDPMPLVTMLKAVDRGLATKRVHDKRDVFQPFLFVGLMLLVLEAAISTRRRRSFPEAAS